jgi:hypothetical protein
MRDHNHSIDEKPLLPRPQFDPDWRSHKAECAPDLILEKSLVREMQLHLPVGEQHKGWGRDRRLSHIQDFDSLSDWDRSTIEINLLQKTVHLAGADPLAPLGCNFLDGGKDVFRAFPHRGRYK